MNKRISAGIFSVGLVVGISAVPISVLAVQGDPIPGVDVSVEQSPSGIKIGATQTNATGIFMFSHLQPGQYVVKFTPPKVKAGVSQNYNSSKSNTAGLVAADGSTVMKVTINLFATEKGIPSEPIQVSIGSTGGTITGTVTEGVPDESFLQRLGRGIIRFFAALIERLRHLFGGGSIPTVEATPTASPKRSPTVTPAPTSLPTRTVTPTPTPQSQQQTPVPTQAVPTATSSPAGGSMSTPTPTPSVASTPSPTPNTDVTVTSVYPKSVSAGQEFSINGTHFVIGRSTAQVTLVRLNGANVPFGIVDSQTIFATANGEPGVYDVSIVTTAGQTITLNAALTIQH